ncbi:hypothetical protein B296_00032672 [Ensete ventricosum]|uniref:Uncharacterized protein n=1 Tax=Ensete ventricosum TaxID=4639 RepID=A0A426XZP2_ENSVE|nr:hypothetical protein B296_00032672 [Ensete ventricosum]
MLSDLGFIYPFMTRRSYVCGNIALNSVCAQISSVGHAVDGLGRALGRSRVGGSRIKRQPHAGLPQAADRNRIKRQSSAAGVASSDHRMQ